MRTHKISLFPEEIWVSPKQLIFTLSSCRQRGETTVITHLILLLWGCRVNNNIKGPQSLLLLCPHSSQVKYLPNSMSRIVFAVVSASQQIARAIIKFVTTYSYLCSLSLSFNNLSFSFAITNDWSFKDWTRAVVLNPINVGGSDQW